MTVTRSALANGLTVVSHRMPEVETVSLGIWIGAGSRSEQPAEHGVAHFLEHMAFKGTKRRSAREIVEEIEAVGGDLNAATSVDSTGYYARVLPADLPLALDILSDIILEPRFDGAELTRERDVILQEIAASSDSPDDIAYDFLSEAAYPDQPVGRPILGTAQSVLGFERKHLGAYLTAHYHAPNMVLAAAGAVDHAVLVAEAERLLAGLSSEPTPIPQRAVYMGGRRQSAKAFEQTHLMIALEAPAYHQPDYFKSQILAGALGGGMSSRLFQEVRERRGHAVSVRPRMNDRSHPNTSPERKLGLDLARWGPRIPSLRSGLVKAGPICHALHAAQPSRPTPQGPRVRGPCFVKVGVATVAT